LLIAVLRCVLRVESLASAIVPVSYDPELFALRC
jgi:hypothetical protein